MTSPVDPSTLSVQVGQALFGCSGVTRPYASDPAAAREVEGRIELFAPGGLERLDERTVRLHLPGIEPVEASAGTPEAALAVAVLRAIDGFASLPFGPAEEELIRERRGFTFGLVDASADRVRIEVLNLARRPFRALTLGSRCRVQGATRDLVLDLEGHEAGKTQVYEVLVDAPFRAQDLEVFPLPRPGPAERLRFVELACAMGGGVGS